MSSEPVPSTPAPTHAVGIDMIEIDRVAKVLARHPRRFIERVYTPEEAAFCRGRVPELAARFAAKEAVMKALGTGWSLGIRWTDIAVENNGAGKPTVQLSGVAERLAGKLAVSTVHLSLAHTRHYASAQVVMEGCL